MPKPTLSLHDIVFPESPSPALVLPIFSYKLEAIVTSALNNIAQNLYLFLEVIVFRQLEKFGKPPPEFCYQNVIRANKLRC